MAPIWKLERRWLQPQPIQPTQRCLPQTRENTRFNEPFPLDEIAIPSTATPGARVGLLDLARSLLEYGPESQIAAEFANCNFSQFDVRMRFVVNGSVFQAGKILVAVMYNPVGSVHSNEGLSAVVAILSFACQDDSTYP